MLIAEDPPRTLPLERGGSARDVQCWEQTREGEEDEGAPWLGNGAAIDGGLRDGHEAPVDALIHDSAARHACEACGQQGARTGHRR